MNDFEPPLGAIENGREFFRRMVEHHDFKCEAGSLDMCADYHEALRCFEHLADWIAAIAAIRPVPDPSAELVELLREAKDMLGDLYPGYISLSEPYNEAIAERDALITRIAAMLSASKAEGEK